VFGSITSPPFFHHRNTIEHFGDRIGAAMRQRGGAFGGVGRGVVYSEQLVARQMSQPVYQAVLFELCRPEHGFDLKRLCA
jgi:hypothetical protein